MAKQTEAQARADAKYKAASTKQIGLRFFPSEMDLYEYMQSKPNKMGYIKELIRRDYQAYLEHCGGPK